MGLSPEVPERFAQPPTNPEPKKEEPVRVSSGTTVVAAALIIVLNKFGVTGFTEAEAVTIVAAIAFLSNEAARLSVWAAYRGQS